MAISYRYHVGSLLAIFLALLLGILVGIGLTSRPEEFEQSVADLKTQYEQIRKGYEAEKASLRQEIQRDEQLSKETVAALVAGRLRDKRVAIILDHDFGRSSLPESLRALVKQAGATLASTTTITRDFVTLPAPVKEKVARQLVLYPPPGSEFRSLIAQYFASELAAGRPRLIGDLQASGLLRATGDSDYSSPVDAVLILGGSDAAQDAAVDRIDLPLIEQLRKEGVWVVGCEAKAAAISCIPSYVSTGIPTVDNADTSAGRLCAVLALAGAEGNFGVKDTADRFLPPVVPAPE